jgi:oligopeptide transport system substrate-binding protein
MRKLFSLVSILVLASMILAACGGAAPTEAPPVTEATQPAAPAPTEAPAVTEAPATEAPAREAVLRVNLGTYPDIVDPQKSSFLNEIAHLNLVYEGLTRFNAQLETVPGAAESWEYNDDATQLTFHLRSGLMYSDGTPLNAARYEYALKRNMNPETAGEYAAITDEIMGAPEWRAADIAAEGYDPAPFEEALGIKASHADGSDCVADDSGNAYADADCNTLTLNFSKPAPYFHTVMGIWVSYPAKQENIEEGGDTWWVGSNFQIGNGQFIWDTLEPYVNSRFSPNPNYWGEKPTYNIDFRYITDSAVSFEAYKNNEFDIVGLAAEDLGTIQADPQLNQEAMIYPGSCTFAMMFHQLKEPFTDQKVREAFMQALDRDAWVNEVLSGLGSSTLTWIPKGYPGYKEDETRWAFDPDAAKAALAESSYGSVENLPEITLTFSDTPRNRTRNEWLAAQWNDVLGVQAKLNPVESTTYTALTKDIETAPQTFILGWCADYPDPQNWLSVYWKTGGFGERIGYSNPDFDALVNEADTTSDPAKRMELYAQAQDLLTEGAPVAFFWNNVNAYLVKPWVKGIQTTPQDTWVGSYAAESITIDTSMIP